MNSIENILRELELLPHPEGGFYKETYRSDNSIEPYALPGSYKSSRNFCTAIYFLLTSDNFSAFHKIKQDEIWHFYGGSAISLHIITKEGAYEKHLIGADISKGEVPQFVVKGGDWFASEIEARDSFGLAGCTVSPGFDFEDFEMADRQDLIERYPDHARIITKLTR
ncbi:cupin domain-containing protein [Lutimonas saemankumensis]|uniref:cupin domain-containing protein n=1 Tax=Lutimonas saemankumensis TaxID=483016 RepID=UPI001CD604E1|nr:cupin domain-containing protein [Lutimonas saemankumensis]MCA0932383.1 cupin domain-containing protein [Lutimonas saemankumensis]